MKIRLNDVFAFSRMIRIRTGTVIAIITFFSLPSHLPFLTTAIEAASDGPFLGQVTFIKGKALVRDGKSWKKIYLGMPIAPGVQIQTAYKSYVVIVMSNNTQLQIRENSMIEISADTMANITSLRMDHGIVATYVQKNAMHRNQYKMRTPTTTAGVRGTFMTITQHGSESRIEVLEGEGYVMPGGLDKDSGL